MTVVLVYHELSDRSDPLCVSPARFSEHLGAIAATGASVLTAAELASRAAAGVVPDRAVVLTFDDCFAAAVREARPRLAAAGMRATFFCVAGHLGGRSDWPSRARGAPVRPLAAAGALEELAAAGHEIGAHGWWHAPLDACEDARREVVHAQDKLRSALGVDVTTFAYPYGAQPSRGARTLVEQHYAAAFSTMIARVDAHSDRWNLPRVDAHYVRDPRVLHRVVEGSLDLYLGARRFGSRARRTFRRDYEPATAGGE